MIVKKKDQINKLIKELHGLRTDLDTTIEQYSIRVNSLIVEMLRVLEGDEIIGDKPTIPRKERIEEMLIKLKRLKVKPNIGRAKDLRRIQILAEKLSEIFHGNV